MEKRSCHNQNSFPSQNRLNYYINQGGDDLLVMATIVVIEVGGFTNQQGSFLIFIDKPITWGKNYRDLQKYAASYSQNNEVAAATNRVGGVTLSGLK